MFSEINLHVMCNITRRVLINEQSWDTQVMKDQTKLLLETVKLPETYELGPLYSDAAYHTFETLLKPKGYYIAETKTDPLNNHRTLICKLDRRKSGGQD